MIDAITYALLKKMHRKCGGGGTTPSSESYKVIEQKASSEVWNIKHDMNKFPCVIVIDSGGNTVYGDVAYVDENNITVTFSAPFSGKVILN